MLDKLLYLLRGKPKFCGRCGRALQENSFTSSERFDRKSGKLLYSRIRTRIYCPMNERYAKHDVYAWHRRV